MERNLLEEKIELETQQEIMETQIYELGNEIITIMNSKNTK